MLTAILCTAAALAVMGCANSGPGELYRPIVAGKPDMNQYELDLLDCRLLARQKPNVDREAVLDTAGDAVWTSVWGGAVGAAASTVRGAASNRRAVARAKERIVRGCMQEAGYKVLD